MSMQQPQQEWQGPGNFDEPGQLQAFSEVRAGDNYRRQKIYPQKRLSWHGKPRGLLAFILLSISFLLTAVGLVLAIMMQNYVNAQGNGLTVAMIGMVGFTAIILVGIIIFAITAAALIVKTISVRRQIGHGYARVIRP